MLELAVQIGAGAGLAGPIKDFVGRSVFHQFTHVHEDDRIGNCIFEADEYADGYTGKQVNRRR